MIRVNCYNCDSDSHSFYMSENGHTMVKCDDCGLLYMNERPDDDEIKQSTAIGQHHGDNDLHVDVHYNPSIKKDYQAILRDIFGGDFSRIGTWLDIGCGHGEFIETIQIESAGKISTLGSEPNINKQESARSRGLAVAYFDLETHEKTYDMVSLLNVYSHLPNPVSFFETLKTVIKPGGEFLVQTGNAADFSAEDIIKPLCLPDHMSFVSENILRDILERIGFEIVSVHKYPLLGLSFKKVTKEIVKFVLPNYDSNLMLYLNWNKYSETNMYIRARLK